MVITGWAERHLQAEASFMSLAWAGLGLSLSLWWAGLGWAGLSGTYGRRQVSRYWPGWVLSFVGLGFGLSGTYGRPEASFTLLAWAGLGSRYMIYRYRGLG